MPRWYADAIYERERHSPKDFGPSETETAGAMTMKQQIDRLRAAQIVQGNWRREKYPPVETLPDDFWPPEYGVDRMDAVDAARRVLRGVNVAKARQEAVDARKAKEAAAAEAAAAAAKAVKEEPTE
jgi:hypothetical protein